MHKYIKGQEVYYIEPKSVDITPIPVTIQELVGENSYIIDYFTEDDDPVEEKYLFESLLSEDLYKFSQEKTIKIKKRKLRQELSYNKAHEEISNLIRATDGLDKEINEELRKKAVEVSKILAKLKTIIFS